MCPTSLALSASSPYWIGTDTGLASYRSKVFEGLPTAGPPYLLSGWHEFEDFMETLMSAGTISSIREVWWDIRRTRISGRWSCASSTASRHCSRWEPWRP